MLELFPSPHFRDGEGRSGRAGTCPPGVSEQYTLVAHLAGQVPPQDTCMSSRVLQSCIQPSGMGCLLSRGGGNDGPWMVGMSGAPGRAARQGGFLWVRGVHLYVFLHSLCPALLLHPGLWEAQNKGAQWEAPTEGAQGRGTDAPTTPSAVTLVWTKHGAAGPRNKIFPRVARAAGWVWKQGSQGI